MRNLPEIHLRTAAIRYMNVTRFSGPINENTESRHGVRHNCYQTHQCSITIVLHATYSTFRVYQDYCLMDVPPIDRTPSTRHWNSGKCRSGSRSLSDSMCSYPNPLRRAIANSRTASV